MDIKEKLKKSDYSYQYALGSYQTWFGHDIDHRVGSIVEEIINCDSRPSFRCHLTRAVLIFLQVLISGLLEPLRNSALHVELQLIDHGLRKSWLVLVRALGKQPFVQIQGLETLCATKFERMTCDLFQKHVSWVRLINGFFNAELLPPFFSLQLPFSVTRGSVADLLGVSEE